MKIGYQAKKKPTPKMLKQQKKPISSLQSILATGKINKRNATKTIKQLEILLTYPETTKQERKIIEQIIEKAKEKI
jgi:cytochrome c-type biogenesis protein CcmH/NrfG